MSFDKNGIVDDANRLVRKIVSGETERSAEQYLRETVKRHCDMRSTNLNSGLHQIVDGRATKRRQSWACGNPSKDSEQGIEPELASELAAKRIRLELSSAPTFYMKNLFDNTKRFWTGRVDTETRGLYPEEETDRGARSLLKRPKERVGPSRLGRVIDNFKMCQDEWEIYQVRLFSAILSTLLSLILGTDADTCTERIMKKYGWKSLHEEAFCMMPRGSGKSTCIGAAVAAVMIEVPKFDAVLYSMTTDKSKELLKCFVHPLMKLQKLGRVHGRLRIVSGRVIMQANNDSMDERQIVSMSARGGVCRRGMGVGLVSLSCAW